jgi:hypothetical protein
VPGSGRSDYPAWPAAVLVTVIAVLLKCDFVAHSRELVFVSAKFCGVHVAETIELIVAVTLLSSAVRRLLLAFQA